MLALLLGVLAIAYPTMSVAQAEPGNCSIALCGRWRIGAWIPWFPDRLALTIEAHPARARFVDGFLYEGRLPHGSDFPEIEGSPTDGTPFVFHWAGPIRGSAVYDRPHRIVFFAEGCCAVHATTLAEGVAPPPMPVAARSLARLRTLHGIALGMTPARVRAIEGPAALQSLPAPPGMEMLAYRRPTRGLCTQTQLYGFERSHLVYVQIADGC